MIIARYLLFQTNSSGQSYKDSKTRLKEMILDEHTEVSGRVVMIDNGVYDGKWIKNGLEWTICIVRDAVEKRCFGETKICFLERERK